MSKWSHLLLQGDPYHTFNVASALEDGPRPGGEDPKRDTRSGEVRKKVALLLKRGGADRRQERPFNIFGADRQCPMYAEDFFPCSLLRQEEMLKALTSNPPPIVWLDSSVKLPSLTQYFAYRWLIRQNYRYCTTDGISFMVRSDHFEKAGLPRLSDKEELERLSGLFRIEELRSFPVIWGRLGSFEKTFRKACCEVEMVHANSIEFKDGWGTISTPDDPYLVWKMPAPLDGRKYDFVKIDLECKPARDTQFRGQFFWAGQGDNLHDERAFTFSAQATNPLLIPAGAHPGWLKTPQVDTIRIDIDNYIGDFKINEVSFWSLGD